MSDDRKFRMHDGQTGSAITVRVTPKSTRNEIVEVLDDGTVKIRLMATSADDRANDILKVYLSDVLGVPQTDIDVVAGEKSKDKLITIANITPAMVQQKILKRLS